MSILASFRTWRAERKQRKRAKYADERGFANPEELEEVRENSSPSWAAADAFAKQFDSGEKAPRY